MPSNGNQSRKAKPAEKRAVKETRSYPVVLVAIAIIAIAVILGYLASSALTGGGNGGQQSFQSFQSAFYSAPRVAVYVTYLNSTTFAYADGCASALIQSIVASRSHHRNMSTIDLAIIANSTSCLVPSGSLGSSNGTSVVPISNCLAMSANEPSIFISYNETNSTAIKSNILHTQGDALFLSECGIASELG